jgi:uncharacterized membrane protein
MTSEVQKDAELEELVVPSHEIEKEQRFDQQVFIRIDSIVQRLETNDAVYLRQTKSFAVVCSIAGVLILSSVGFISSFFGASFLFGVEVTKMMYVFSCVSGATFGPTLTLLIVGILVWALCECCKNREKEYKTV